MCRFLFLGVAKHHRALLQRELAPAGLELAPTENPHVIAAFPRGDVVRTVTRGGCSCDISGDRGQGFDEPAEREKYRKRGWSAPKIERAIRARRPRADTPFDAFRGSFARIVRGAGAARVLSHWFSGDLRTEEVHPARELVRLDDYLGRGGTLADDVLHDVRGV